MTRRSSVRPLRRRPKQLTQQPALYEASAGGAGLTLSSGDRRRRAGRAGGGATARGATEEPADQVALTELTDDAGAVTRARARRIARRLAFPRPPRDRRNRRGVNELTSLRYRGGSDELDLDATRERTGHTRGGHLERRGFLHRDATPSGLIGHRDYVVLP